jgi:hypothetical protein
MAVQATDDRIRGTTLRWTFSEGPQAGKTYEHAFHQDGTVSYRTVEEHPADVSPGVASRADSPAGERPPYAAYPVSATVALVSYRADSGFTLTVALNYATHEMVGVASNSAQWFPARGTFAEIDTPRT